MYLWGGCYCFLFRLSIHWSYFFFPCCFLLLCCCLCYSICNKKKCSVRPYTHTQTSDKEQHHCRPVPHFHSWRDCRAQTPIFTSLIIRICVSVCVHGIECLHRCYSAVSSATLAHILVCVIEQIFELTTERKRLQKRRPGFMVKGDWDWHCYCFRSAVASRLDELNMNGWMALLSPTRLLGNQQASNTDTMIWEHLHSPISCGNNRCVPLDVQWVSCVGGLGVLL